MKGTGRAIVIGSVVLLAAMGTGVAVERASSHSRTPSVATVPASLKATDTVIVPVSSAPERAQAGATSSSSEEYDRSDLLLSQG
jgi:hypothetical protein